MKVSQIAGEAAPWVVSPLPIPRWTSPFLLPKTKVMQPSSPQISADAGASQKPAAILTHQPFPNGSQGKGGCRAVVLQLPGYFSPACEKHVLICSARLCLSDVI